MSVFIIGSINPAKKLALENAIQKLYDDLGLQGDGYEIIAIEVFPGDISKPVGYEMLRCAEKRLEDLRKFANLNKIKYDYLCSVEGGIEIDNCAMPFVVTYAIIEDSSGKKSTGKSFGVRVTSDMYHYYKEGHSLNDIIEEVTGITDNKLDKGIIGYLSNGKYSRSESDSQAITSAFFSHIYDKERQKLNDAIRLKKAEAKKYHKKAY